MNVARPHRAHRAPDVPASLARHLRASLGAWPPVPDRTTVASSPARERPGWDGVVVPVTGLATPEGTIVSVPGPDLAEAPRHGDRLRLEQWLAQRFASPRPRLDEAVHRWTVTVADHDDAGTWAEPDDPDVPEWLRPFNGGVLVATVGGRPAAGVGIKRHDDDVSEIAVVTEPAFRGRGFAARLVAQAARRILAGGAVPVYLHARDNDASARVAESVGFPDRGWRHLELAR